MLARLAGSETTKGHELVRETHDDALGGLAKVFGALGAASDSVSSDGVWRGALYNGSLLQHQYREVPLLAGDVVAAVGPLSNEPMPSKDAIEVNFQPDSALWDGEHANNLWGLELPDPMTKIVWDNPALLSPATAAEMGVKNGQMLRLSLIHI